MVPISTKCSLPATLQFDICAEDLVVMSVNTLSEALRGYFAVLFASGENTLSVNKT